MDEVYLRCERCTDEVESRLLNDVGLCGGCVSDEEKESERSLSGELRALANDPDEK